MEFSQALAAGLLLTLSAVAIAQDASWQPITGAEDLRSLMSGLKVERSLPSGEVSRGEYNDDGTGTLFAWGAAIPRRWSITGDDQICISEGGDTQCYRIERSAADPGLFRAVDVATGRAVEFRRSDGRTRLTGQAAEPGDRGSAATPSASELAAELSNPNTAVASLTFKNQFRFYAGSLPNASNQESYSLTFQPSLPFVLKGGDKILWRPAIPVFVNQPVFNANQGDFEGKSGLGDIAFDLAYAPKTEGGLLFAYGVITSLPTATNDLGTKRWTLGPEVLIGKITPKYVLGIFPNHQWDVGGSGNADINLTSVQAFYTYLPGGGWSVGSSPTISYDGVSRQGTVPLQINAGKTVVLGGRPWKFSVELNYYVERPDAFGPKWMVGLNVAPVVKNGLAAWFGL